MVFIWFQVFSTGSVCLGRTSRKLERIGMDAVPSQLFVEESERLRILSFTYSPGGRYHVLILVTLVMYFGSKSTGIHCITYQ